MSGQKSGSDSRKAIRCLKKIPQRSCLFQTKDLSSSLAHRFRNKAKVLLISCLTSGENSVRHKAQWGFLAYGKKKKNPMWFLSVYRAWYFNYYSMKREKGRGKEWGTLNEIEHLKASKLRFYGTSQCFSTSAT